MRFTERCLRIFNYAELEAMKKTKVVYPLHLLKGLLLERTGVCADLNIHKPYLIELVDRRLKEMKFVQEDEGISYKPFTVKISPTTKQVLEIASGRMERFNQVYINEGHILDAIFRDNDQSTNNIFEGLDVSCIFEIVAYPRDMIVPLRDYSFPTIPATNITIRRVEQSDTALLKSFVVREFGDAWLESIENGFLYEKIPIFIALNEDQIVGFSCFDVVRRKKGLFGPMGTSFSNRVKGIGYTLLHFCLREMKEIGYEYAIIGEAGPLEFYEKSCNAVVIPKKYEA
ncbi:GNAT family N-acetyltransferase [Bacillus sp. FJAT-27445]|uniref:GNAT family N-acetyltransferase n=1 Tax=Bacillus sp. FJAT-27445 TaxID=1679166 RepID=UPI000743CFCC|nr:GNAT family N-acetyltransferase [Bacillus sp. FJAT-27445]